MRYDHHCKKKTKILLLNFLFKYLKKGPWVNNCVGYGNYKFFFLFINYTSIGSIVMTILILLRFLTIKKSGRMFEEGVTAIDIQLLVCGMLMFAFGFATGSLAGYHCRLLYLNRTTSEDHYRVFQFVF